MTARNEDPRGRARRERGRELYVSFVATAIKLSQGFSEVYGARRSGVRHALLLRGHHGDHAPGRGGARHRALPAGRHPDAQLRRRVRAPASDAGSDGAAGMSRDRASDLTHVTKRTRAGGKSPKHANDPAEMLAGERALWSDAAKVTLPPDARPPRTRTR